jgi:hypothetical protein
MYHDAERIREADGKHDQLNYNGTRCGPGPGCVPSQNAGNPSEFLMSMSLMSRMGDTEAVITDYQ